MNVDELLDKPYSEIHFAKVTFKVPMIECGETVGYEAVDGWIIGRSQGVQMMYDGHTMQPEPKAPTITLRTETSHRDVNTNICELLEYKPCDDVEAIKEEWSE